MNEMDKGSALPELVFQFTAEALSWRPEAKEGGESGAQKDRDQEYFRTQQ